MVRAILFYFNSFLKKSAYFYFFSLLFLLLFYYETFGLLFNMENDIEIYGLWIDGGTDIVQYIKHIGLHYVIFILFGSISVMQIASSFFSADYLGIVLPKISNRNFIYAYFVGLIALGIVLFFAVHVVLLNIFLYLISSSLFFIPSLKTIIFIVPLAFFFSTSITAFSIISENKFANLIFVLSYLIFLPVVFELIINADYNTNAFINFLALYNDYYIPFSGSFLTGTYKYAFKLDVFPVWQGYIIMSAVFLLIGMSFFKRKIY